MDTGSDSIYILIALACALLVGVWVLSGIFMHKTKSGKVIFYINLAVFVLYTALCWYEIPQQKDWEGLGLIILWIVLAGIQSLTILIIGIIHKIRQRKF